MPTVQDYRNLELEAAAMTAVGRGSTALGLWLKAVSRWAPSRLRPG